MIRGENSDSIPMDLVMEILSRLPTKSIVRFCCVSKVWGSMLLSPYFTELFLTRSSARLPRLLFACKRLDDWCFMTSPQPQNPYENSSSLVVTADFQMKFPGNTSLDLCGHASGFICFCRGFGNSEEDGRKVYAICNPSTGQYARLPSPKWRMKSTDWTSFLGFDTVDKQYKVLSTSVPRFEDNNKKEEPDQILTLGTGNDSWRKIHCKLNHDPSPIGICINGVVYYLARRIKGSNILVCFDVRSEKFKFLDFINYQYDTSLIDYKGKLGVIALHYDNSRYRGEGRGLELCMWVIKDVERPKSEWTKYFSFRFDNHFYKYHPYIVGGTATGDIVLSMRYWEPSKPFYVFYLSPERNTLQSVEIKGFGDTQFDTRVEVIVDYVEDLKFIMMKSTNAATSSISPPEQKRNPTSTSTISAKAHLQQDGRTFESINKFDSLRLFDDDECT